jgi:CheY-like chemotaxis protein
MQQEQAFEILVVDDEPPIYDLLVRIGKQAFPEATFANTRGPRETIDYLDQHPTKLPHLILLDIDLKQATDGLDLLPQLVNRFKGQVPIVVFTSSTRKLDVQRAYQNGAIAYTQKPDELPAWKDYVAMLKTYWYNTTLLPQSVSPSD